MGKNTKKEVKTKQVSAKPKSEKTKAPPKGQFGYFDQINSTKSKYFEKPQQIAPHGGRNKQGKP